MFNLHREITMEENLFLMSEETKGITKRKWLQGAPFESPFSNPKYISINNVDSVRGKFKRVIIQYKNGTMEV